MKKFRNFVAEEMSVTLKQHGSTSYKVHAVGSKMKAHGGLRVGETVHDHHIDDLRDSGIKVRYHKEDVDVNEGFDKIGKSGRHDVHFTDTSDYHWSSKHASGVSHGGKGSDPAHEDQFHYQFKHHKIDVNDHQSKTKMSHVKQRVQASGVSPHHVDNVSKHIHAHITAESVQYEAIERKADSKLIMVTDPNTGKTVLRKAPRKEIEIGKGKMESVEVNEMEGAQRPVRGKDKETLDYSRSVVAQMRAKRLADKKKINAKEEVVNEKSAAEVLKKRYASDSPEDNPQATKRIKDHIPGMKTFRAHPGVKFQPSTGTYSKKGKMAALKKQHARRPEQYGITREETVNEISDKMKVNYINKANKQITDKEKAGKGQDTMKRRMGVRMAKSKLGEEEKYSKKEVRMGKGVAFDKRYKQGNYSGAHKTIEKIKKGLASHPKVADALRRANEEFNKGE